MKKLLLLSVIINFISGTGYAQVGIGTLSPDNSAQLELSSVTKGFLPPRMTTVQRDAIINTATGLVIFNLTLGCLEYFQNGAWYSLIGICGVPAMPLAGVPTPSGGQIVWNWTAVSGATGYKYNTINNYATATNNLSLITYTETGIACGSPLHTLYVWAYNNCGNSLPVTLTATPASAPIITGTTPSSVCGTGTVTLGATASAGTLNWYAVSTGGSPLGTGTVFVTPLISVNTTYHVDAINNGCTTPARTPVLATVNAIPMVVSTIPAARCGTGTVTLGATASAGTLNWYAASTGGASLGTGTAFITPVISVSTNYYVDATDNGCTTAIRTTVLATINDIPSIISIIPASRCGTGTVTLGATASAGTLNWYAASTGGASLGTGTAFITPVISVNTNSNYYVDATDNGCTTATRTAVLATINSIPVVAVVTGASTVIQGHTTQFNNNTAGGVWASSNTGFATVDANGLVTGVAVGSLTITYTVTVNGCSTTVNKPLTVIAPLVLGQLYQGGYIFYIDASGEHGLIAYPNDISAGAQWGCDGTGIGCSGGGIGLGQPNTNAILAGCNATTNAAALCNNLGGWFLPSANELSAMCIISGPGALNPTAAYWSSTEASTTQAFALACIGGGFGAPKTNQYNVRPAAAF